MKFGESLSEYNNYLYEVICLQAWEMTFKKWQQMINILTNYPRDELSLSESSKQSSRASVAPTSSAIPEEKLEVSM